MSSPRKSARRRVEVNSPSPSPIKSPVPSPRLSRAAKVGICYKENVAPPMAFADEDVLLEKAKRMSLNESKKRTLVPLSKPDIGKMMESNSGDDADDKYSVTSSEYDDDDDDFDDVDESSSSDDASKEDGHNEMTDFASFQAFEMPVARDTEFMEIYKFCQFKLSDNSSGTMFISGMPGTGKSMTIKCVISELASTFGPSTFKCLFVNAFKLKQPRKLFSLMWKCLSNSSTSLSPVAATKNLIKYYEGAEKVKNAKRSTLLLVVDELDTLVSRVMQTCSVTNRKQSGLLYSLFHWPTLPNSRLIVLAIANTLDLPERLLSMKIQSRMGLTRVVFQPYTFSDLLSIAKASLPPEALKRFKDEALILAAKKVSIISGDARRVIDICKQAHLDTQPTSKKIDIAVMNNVINKTFENSRTLVVRNASEMERMLLETIASEFRKFSCVNAFGGMEETKFRKLVKPFRALLSLAKSTKQQQGGSTSHSWGINNLPDYIVSAYQLQSACQNLVRAGILNSIPCDSSISLDSKISLNLTLDELNYALSGEINDV